MHKLSTLALAVIGLAACGDDGNHQTYVLVHGAFMGSSGWDQVADRLRDSGADVHVFDLPAHGADATPIAGATFDAYVARVEAELDAAVKPVTLVGHSMGGMVISQVAEQRPNDLAGLVYIAAFLPQSGQSLLDLAMMDADSELGAALEFHEQTIGIKQDQFVDLFCADCDAAGKAALAAGYKDEPSAPLMTKAALGAAFAGVHKTYLHTGADRVVSPALQAQMVTATPVDREVTLPTSHVPMLAAPADVAQALLDE